MLPQGMKDRGFVETPSGIKRVSLEKNAHHDAYIRIRTDEVLYRAGILPLDQMDRDADPESEVTSLELCRDFLSLAGVKPPPLGEPRNVVTALMIIVFPLFYENSCLKGCKFRLHLGARNLAVVCTADGDEKLSGILKDHSKRASATA